MTDMLAFVDVETFRALDLAQAETKFDEIKLQMFGAAPAGAPLPRVRSYLHAIEDILSEKHEARRSGDQHVGCRGGEAVVLGLGLKNAETPAAVMTGHRRVVGEVGLEPTKA